MKKFITIVLLTLIGTSLTSTMRPVPVETTPLLAETQTVPKGINVALATPKAVSEVFKHPVAKAAPAQIVAQSGAKAFIYEHESGNNPGAVNQSSGACGLGQALPCSKMPCSLSDYACQDNFFTQYMLERYGTWENAVSFWLSHKWW